MENPTPHPRFSGHVLKSYFGVVWLPVMLKFKNADSFTGSLGPRPKPDTGSDPRWGWFGSGAETVL